MTIFHKKRSVIELGLSNEINKFKTVPKIEMKSPNFFFWRYDDKGYVKTEGESDSYVFWDFYMMKIDCKKQYTVPKDERMH